MTDALRDAVQLDAYLWMESNAPVYLAAIEHEVSKGASAADIRSRLVAELGPDRQALVRRCYQAAAHFIRSQE